MPENEKPPAMPVDIYFFTVTCSIYTVTCSNELIISSLFQTEIHHLNSYFSKQLYMVSLIFEKKSVEKYFLNFRLFNQILVLDGLEW